MQKMFTILTEDFAHIKLSWKPNSLAMIENTANHDETLSTHWNTALGDIEIKLVSSFIALGIGIDRRGSTDFALRHRSQCFWSSWHASREIFCSRREPLTERIRRFYSTLGRSLLFGAGGWGLSESVLRKLEHIESICLRQMMCRHKLDSEDWNQHNARRRGIIAAALDRAKTMPLSLQACHLYFGWAGHLVRLPATRPVRRVVGWRDLWWFRSRSDGPEGLVRPRLAKCGMPSRWEDTLEKHIGIGWSTYGVDRKGWCIKKWTVATNCWVKLLNKKAIGQAWHDPVAHISPRLESSVPKLAWHLKKI